MGVPRRYETIFIAKPNLSPDDLKNLADKMRDIMVQGGGQIVKFDEWGVKRLAYAVKKHNQGFYFFTDYAGAPALVKELERNIKIDDRVIKYLTVKIEDALHAESPQVEAEEEKAKEEPASVVNPPAEAAK
ncbi:MAG: 30S ribosomal protein S6 [Deltaproteobacteria bacterium]|nr:30S ribosomal protein S6 [Deltaproteobacteria bacterium]